MKGKKKTILDAQGIQSALENINERILADFPDSDELILIGIRTGGAFLAHRLRGLILSQ